jgi:hypothetical protein
MGCSRDPSLVEHMIECKQDRVAFCRNDGSGESLQSVDYDLPSEPVSTDVIAQRRSNVANHHQQRRAPDSRSDAVGQAGPGSRSNVVTLPYVKG